MYRPRIWEIWFRRLKRDLTKIWNYFNTDPQGLHHVAHFFIAGWVANATNLAVVFLLALGIELRDWYIKHEDEYHKVVDHFWDIVSWMLGAIVWGMLTTPIAGWFS